jgi:hypothetical protein
MKLMGFRCIACGKDGAKARAIAAEWEARYQAARKGDSERARRTYPRNSVGDAFEQIRASKGWARKPITTREEWERAWKSIDPVFGDLHPKRVGFLHLDNWYETLLEKKGDDFAWRCMKIWRALYNKMAAMKLCPPGADPSKAIRRKKPKARDQTWLYEEYLQFVDRAWKEGYYGLACIVSVAWDTQFNPGDVRALTPKQALEIGMDWGFGTHRRKTGGKALGLLSARTRKLVQAYVDGLGYELLDDAPIFRTRGYAPGPKGGRPRQGVPYTKGSLINDFAKIRELVFGPSEERQLRDMRRAGAQEALAGGVDLKDLATSMVNDIDDNEELRRTYGPTQAASVRATAESRERGRLKQAAEHNRIKKLKLGPRKS